MKLRRSDKTAHKRLMRILKEMQREDPRKGIGKPEPLKHKFSGLWSRRLNDKDRLVYNFDQKAVYLHMIGKHYDDH